MPHVHIPDLPWIEQRSPGGTYHSFCRNVSLALGGIANTGTHAGGHPFDVQIRRIPPGAAVCPYHSHFAQWELIWVQSGVGTVRAGDLRREVRVGDVFVHPPGHAHQLINTGADDLVVLIVADNPPLDACYYPDSNKWGLRPPGKFFRMTEVGYFEGEEPPTEAAAAFRPAAAPRTLPVTPFAERIVNVETVPWETWTSPKGTFRGASKELSIALGAKRNTPSGLGGHPFDLEWTKLGPGETPCPFHRHAAQWELFLVLAGTAIVRAEAATLTLRAGDVVLHPPGEAHQIRNAAADAPLEFLLIADNPPVEYCYYPDSDKWGLRDPRLLFRPQVVDYYDREE